MSDIVKSDGPKVHHAAHRNASNGKNRENPEKLQHVGDGLVLCERNDDRNLREC